MIRAEGIDPLRGYPPWWGRGDSWGDRPTEGLSTQGETLPRRDPLWGYITGETRWGGHDRYLSSGRWCLPGGAFEGASPAAERAGGSGAVWGVCLLFSPARGGARRRAWATPYFRDMESPSRPHSLPGPPQPPLVGGKRRSGVHPGPQRPGPAGHTRRPWREQQRRLAGRAAGSGGGGGGGGGSGASRPLSLPGLSVFVCPPHLPARLPEPDSVCLQRGRQLPLQIRCRRAGESAETPVSNMGKVGREPAAGPGSAASPSLPHLPPPVNPAVKPAGSLFKKIAFHFFFFFHTFIWKNASRALSSRVIFSTVSLWGGGRGTRLGLRRRRPWQTRPDPDRPGRARPAASVPGPGGRGMGDRRPGEGQRLPAVRGEPGRERQRRIPGCVRGLYDFIGGLAGTCQERLCLTAMCSFFLPFFFS